MPTYSIQGPDGKTYSIDGPAGATREQVIAKIKEKQPQLGAAPAPQSAPPQQQPITAPAGAATQGAMMRGGMGATGGTVDPTMMKRFAMGAAAPVVGFAQKGADLLFGEGGQADQAAKAFNDARDRLAKQAGIKPGQTNVADLAGQVASPANYAGGGLVRGAGVLARVGKAALAGGFSGATQPDSSDQPLSNAAKGGATGAVLGGGIGAAAEAASGLVSRGAKAIYGMLAGTPGQDAAAHNTAVAKILARHENDAAGGGPTATQAIAAVNEARARGAPMALADVSGKNVRRLAGSVSRAPGAAPQMAEGFAKQQLEGASKRLSDLVGENIASGPTMRKTADALTVGQKAAAAPLYEKAFNTGSREPLIPTIQKSVAEASKAEAAAMRDVADAQAQLAGAARPKPKAGAPTRVGPSLLQWISKRGGVYDLGGDLKSMGADQWHVGKRAKPLIIPFDKGHGNLLGSSIRDDKGLDDVARAAWEEGYLPGAERPDQNALIDAIGEELRGKKIYTQEDQHILEARDQNARYADYLEELKGQARSAAEARGETLTKSEEHHAAELIAAGAHPDAAIEDAGQALRNERTISDEKRSRMAYQRQRLAKAQATIETARKSKLEAAAAMREAQGDMAAGKRGGIYSPRVQQFLSDPTIKPAIARGLEIQRLEALAEGKQFNPHDYSVVGEKDGEPIVGKVPNMRLLDAVKKGIDDMLEHYRSDITGKLVLDERGRALDQVRRSYIKTLDELNPDYSKARAAWAGPAQAKGTMGLGSKHLSRNVEENEKIWSGLSPSDRQFYLIGVADHLRDEIAKKGVTSPMVNALKEGSHNSRIKEQLRMLFSDQAKFDQFLKSVTDERTIFEKAGERLRGSQTAERLGADEENGLAAGAHALAAGAKVVNGHWAGAIQSLVAAKRDLGIIGDKKVNDALAKLLFDPSIDLNGPVGLRLIGRIPVAQAKAMSYVERFRRLTSPAAAAGGALAQQGQQPGNQGNPAYAQ